MSIFTLIRGLLLIGSWQVDMSCVLGVMDAEGGPILNY